MFDDTGSSIQTKTGSGIISSSTWTHIVGTYDGSSTAAGVNLYKDGVLLSSTDIGSPITGSILTTTPLVIGQRDTSGIYTFEGNGSNSSIYGKELTALEVTGIYDQGRASDVDYSAIPNVISHWRLNSLNPVDEIGSNNGTSNNMDASNIVCE
jgi:hypothetical protein